jgi:hypothetical protein
MAIQNKTFMNFLGGEVSPSAYKRLDMAGNAKWFETAKNIWFGTTGDFHNRRGFQYIAKTALGLSNEKIKLIPFYFNREQSYCIEFNSNTFRILNNGILLKDGNDDVINVRHEGLSVEDVDDISYCQIADVLYICTGSKNRIYTIKRYSDTDWRWEEFEYEIPPMRQNNEDKNKKLLFGKNTTYGNYGSFSIVIDKLTQITDISVKISISDVETTIYSNSIDLSDLNEFVSDFNTNQTGTTNIKSCQSNDNKLIFNLTETGASNVDSVSVIVDDAYIYEAVYDYPVGSYNFNGWSEVGHNYNASYYYLERRIPCNSLSRIKRIDYIRYDNGFEGSKQQFQTNYNTPYPTPSDVASSIQDTGYASISYDSLSNCFVLRGTFHRDTGRFWRIEIIKLVETEPIHSQKQYYSDRKEIVEIQTNNYDVEATFDFFKYKNVNDIFAVESIYSPNKDGKAGENKSFYSNSISTGETVTDPFWSNGNWRIVTSGLFSGSIEMQYSYDGVSWFTHRTFSSSIRTENNVSYSTNYNEYGSLDVDDNVLLRLRFNLTAQTNLTVVFDTESFKNRSYYKILAKDATYPDTKAIVECIKYPIGTPGIDKYISGEEGYNVNKIYSWAESAWSYENGYPKFAFLYQDRLGFAATTKDFSTIWFSKTRNYNDFSTKIEYTDDDPIIINVLTPTGIGEISNVAAAKKLFVFTSENENGIQDEGALTQTNKQLINFTFYGSDPIQTRTVSNKIIFVERGGRAARALTYDYAQENYEAIDLTIPYKHLLKDEKIIASEYIAGDYKTYLMLTSGGRIICFKYLPEQKIEACSWFRHASATITNICVVPYFSDYHLYVAVDDGTKKQLEIMKISPIGSSIYLDSYKEFYFEEETSTVIDADYIIPNKEYTVIIEDLTYKIKSVDNTINLPRPATSCVVGFNYVSEGTLLPPNLLFQNGTTNYNRKNLFKAHFSYIDSALFKVGVKGRDGSFKKVYAIEEPSLSEAERNESGEKSFPIQSSYYDQNMLSFIQEDPAPMNITNAELEVDYGGK